MVYSTNPRAPPHTSTKRREGNNPIESAHKPRLFILITAWYINRLIIQSPPPWGYFPRGSIHNIFVINHIIISFTSPIFNSGARDNIFPSSHNTLCLLIYTSTPFNSLAPTHDLPPAPLYTLYHGLLAGGQTAPSVLDLGYRRRALHLRRRSVRRISVHV